ncbi:hypothetical protein F3J34_15185 [Klebsiella sp. Ap-873]|nr:hypothetical protein [Klebsiella sp. Ap-873]
MPRGLLIDLNDGSPRMEITAGLRCPSFSGSNGDQIQTGGVVGVTKTPGSTMVMLPVTTTYAYPDSISPIPSIGMMTGYADNGNGTITQSWWHSNPRLAQRLTAGAANYVEILAISQSGNRGLLISESTDFTFISSATQFMGCVWYGNFTVNGSTPLPASGIPFASWDSPDVSIAFDGTNLTSFLAHDGYGDAARPVTIRLAIFARVDPTPGRGLTFVNPDGKVTFSTTRKPFVFRNAFWNPASGAANASGNMVMICRTGFRNRNAGGWCNMKHKGIIFSGGVVSSASNNTKFSWTDQYPIIDERTINLNIPLIPAMY